ncbi:hypothetical protein AAG570_006257 [Ranatra chinensis]|uniref:Uncharacterized protein n=1 Tax=Ranatra chinensis TaxID=642074 RepID=A0ABD0YTJ9_9HEMI
MMTGRCREMGVVEAAEEDADERGGLQEWWGTGSHPAGASSQPQSVARPLDTRTLVVVAPLAGDLTEAWTGATACRLWARLTRLSVPKKHGDVLFCLTLAPLSQAEGTVMDIYAVQTGSLIEFTELNLSLPNRKDTNKNSIRASLRYIVEDAPRGKASGEPLPVAVWGSRGNTNCNWVCRGGVRDTFLGSAPRAIVRKRNGIWGCDPVAQRSGAVAYVSWHGDSDRSREGPIDTRSRRLRVWRYPWAANGIAEIDILRSQRLLLSPSSGQPLLDRYTPRRVTLPVTIEFRLRSTEQGADRNYSISTRYHLAHQPN